MSVALEIRNLHVSVEDKPILKGVNLTVRQGEVHALMGPNGSGKSTLAYALMGHPAYEVTAGEILFDGVDLLEMEADERSKRGLFLAFQYPVAIRVSVRHTKMPQTQHAQRTSRLLPHLDHPRLLAARRRTRLY